MIVFNVFILSYNCSILAFIEHYCQDRQFIIELGVPEKIRLQEGMYYLTAEWVHFKKVVAYYTWWISKDDVNLTPEISQMRIT